MRMSAGPTPNLSPHQDKIHKFVTYLNTELMEIKPHLWFDFSLDAMRLVQSYLDKGKESAQSTETPAPAEPQAVNTEVRMVVSDVSPAVSLPVKAPTPSPSPRPVMSPAPYSTWLPTSSMGLIQPSSSYASLMSPRQQISTFSNILSPTAASLFPPNSAPATTTYYNLNTPTLYTGMSPAPGSSCRAEVGAIEKQASPPSPGEGTIDVVHDFPDM